MSEPVSALAIAGNVLQFVEVGLRLVLKAREVYKSHTGLCKEHERLETVALNLQKLSLQLEHHVESENWQAGATPLHFQQANQECLDLSHEFLQLLSTLKPAAEKLTHWKSTKLAARGIWGQDKIRRVEEALKHARENLILSLLGLLKSQNENLNNSITESSTRTQALLVEFICRNEAQHGPEAWKGVVDAKNGGIHDLYSAFKPSLQHSDLDETSLLTLRSPVVEQSTKELDAIEQGISDLSTIKVCAGRRLIQSLHYFELDAWQIHVESPHEDTFSWITNMESSGHNDFIQWLEKSPGPGLFWICGKPGSGKSTMMRYLDQQFKDVTKFTGWLGDSRFLKASAFLWHGSSTIQRSIAGLLRSLLYQIWREIPDVVSEAVSPQRWISALGSENELDPWTTNELKSAFEETLRLTDETSNHHAKILLLLDGLDEYGDVDKDTQELIDLVTASATNPHVKIVVASRPSVVHKCAFELYPQITLEAMTTGDLLAYTKTKLCSNKLYQRLHKRAPQLTDLLVTELVERANGVFLWVSLVVREILKVVRDGGSIFQVTDSLKVFPTDLEHYYMQMLQSIPASYRRDASIIFQVALQDVTFTPNHQQNSNAIKQAERSVSPPESQMAGPCFLLLYLRYMDDDLDPDFTLKPAFEVTDFADDEEVDYWLDVLERRLTSRCVGLLEVKPASGHESPRWNTMVAFLHRSVKDFLMTPNIQQMLHEWSGGAFDVDRFRVNTVAADIVSFSNPATSKDLHGLRLYAFSCFLALVTRQHELRSEDRAYHKLFEWLLPQLQLGSDDWPRLDRKARVGTSHVALDVTDRWLEDLSDCLSFAVALGWDSYVREKMDGEKILAEPGRPLLDYALRPCRMRPDAPHADMVEFLLSKGADPDELYNGASVLVHFIASLVLFGAEGEDECNRTVDILLSKRTSRQIPLSQLVTALNSLPVEGETSTEDLMAVLENLQSLEPLKISDDGDKVLEVCDVLSAIAQCDVASYESSVRTSEEEQPATPASQMTTLSQTGLDQPLQTTSWPQGRTKETTKFYMRPLTPEPKCGYSQKT